jgi:hypothetical protein
MSIEIAFVDVFFTTAAKQVLTRDGHFERYSHRVASGVCRGNRHPEWCN